MSDSFRGLVAEFSKDNGKTMPQAYRHLMEAGLLVSETELENFDPNVQLDEDLQTILELDEDEYELVVDSE